MFIFSGVVDPNLPKTNPFWQKNTLQSYSSLSFLEGIGITSVLEKWQIGHALGTDVKLEREGKQGPALRKVMLKNNTQKVRKGGGFA